MDATARTRALTGVVTDLQICRAVFTRILRGVTIAGHFVTGYRRRRALRATRVSARIAVVGGRGERAELCHAPMVDIDWIPIDPPELLDDDPQDQNQN